MQSSADMVDLCSLRQPSCPIYVETIMMILPGLGKAAPRGRISLVNIRCRWDNYLIDDYLIDDGHGDDK